MSPRDRFLIVACHIGLVVSVLWTILYAGQIVMIVTDGAPPTPILERLQVCQQMIPAAILGVVMMVICVRVPERIKRRYPAQPTGFQIRPRRG